MTRMVIYTQDSYGLGHLRRTTLLANALVSRKKDLTILMVVDSPLAPFFEINERIDFIKLPTIVKVDAGVFRPHQLAVDYKQVKRLRERTICGILETFDPHVVLVDHMPGGANNELMPALEQARQRGMQAKCVVGLRDIIDDPAVTRGLWKREKVYETMEQFYDAVLVYGSSDYFPTAEKYGISHTVNKPVHYCGHVCDLSSVCARLFRKEGSPVVTAIAGGGADSYQLMRAFLGAIEQIQSVKSIHSRLVTGPFLRPDLSQEIQRRAEGLGVSFHRSFRDTRVAIHASDIVIGMAGYNTVCEIMHAGKRAIIAPRPGPSKEQTIRASILEERGIAMCEDLSSLTGAKLAESVEKLLHSSVKKGRIPELNGVSNAADFLLHLVT